MYGDGTHQCHFCGEWVKDGLDPNGDRHWLSDCRPDLVKHEPGETCTWSHEDSAQNCYAYQDFWTGAWGPNHIHFHEDGPM
jgi:hypothetical protein